MSRTRAQHHPRRRTLVLAGMLIVLAISGLLLSTSQRPAHPGTTRRAATVVPPASKVTSMQQRRAALGAMDEALGQAREPLDALYTQAERLGEATARLEAMQQQRLPCLGRVETLASELREVALALETELVLAETELAIVLPADEADEARDS